MRNVRKSDIQLTVNGRNRSFSYNADSEVLNATINLERGRNTVKITASNRYGRDEDQVTISYDEKPTGQRPGVNITSTGRPSTALNGCRTTVTATVRNVNSKRDITFRLNGRTVSQFDFSASSGQLRATVDLIKGNNAIAIRAQNNYGSAEDNANVGCEGSTTPSGSAPTVQITRPAKSSIATTSASERIEAKVTNVSSKNDIAVKVNGRAANFSYSGGRVTLTANLTAGNNTVAISAQNRYGNDRDEVNIRYSKPTSSKRPPQVSISAPTNGKAFSNPDATVKATVRYVRSKNDITFYVNGKRETNFSYNGLNGTFSANIKLQSGNNTIRIKGVNNDGSDEASVSVTYRQPGNAPTVTISSPRNNTTVNTISNEVIASIKGISHKSDIEFLVNGKRISNFSYNTSNRTFNGIADLRSGKNTIEVIAKNNYGTGSDKVTVTYTVPKLPIVDIIAPKNGMTTDKNSASVRATIKNVPSKSGVTLTVNGTKMTNFTYSNGVLGAVVQLRNGRNTITVTGKNNDGTDQESVTVTYKVTVSKPTVTITVPSNNAVLNTNKTSVKAIVKNVSGKKDISVTVGVENITAFNYNPDNGQVTFAAELGRRATTIRVVAENDGGRAEDQIKVSYKLQPTTPAPKITVESVSKPASNPFTPNIASSIILAKITNVNRTQITLTVNGSNVSNFIYTESTGQFNATVQLQKGKNTIIIEAKNSGGTDKVEREINF